MKRKELAIATALLALVSHLCLKGMKAIDKKMEEEKKKKEEKKASGQIVRSARLFFAKTAAFYLSSALCSNRSFISRILPICRLE